jgi:hypothetical protein
MRISMALITASLFFAAMGCASSDTEEPEQEGGGAAVSVGGSLGNREVDLSPNKEEQGPWPAACQPYRQLSVTTEAGGLRAQLEERLAPSSTCLRQVDPDTREYKKLVAKNGDCGTKLYTAESGTSSIRIIDNARRTCLDLVPQPKLIVTEVRSGTTTTMFSTKVKP